MLYQSPTDSAVAVGSLTRESAQLLKPTPGKPARSKLPPQDYQISALPLQAVRLEILPQTVQRPEQWIAPTVEAWQTFVAQQPPTRMEQPQYSLERLLNRPPALVQHEPTEGGAKAAQAEREANQAQEKPEVKPKVKENVKADVNIRGEGGAKLESKPELAQWQERYQAVLQQVAPSLQEVASRRGALPPEVQDRAVALQLLKDRLQQNSKMDVQRDPVNVEIIRTLAASPEAQRQLRLGGKQSLCDYINTQMQAAQQHVASAQQQSQIHKARVR